MSSHILCLRAVEDEGDSQFELPFPKHPEVEEDRPDSDLSGLVGHQVHQMITEDMLDIVARLKDNSISLGSILKDDAAKLEELENHTDVNLRKIKSENKDLQQQLKSSSSNTMWFWIIILFVTLVFVWMVIFIKLSPKR